MGEGQRLHSEVGLWVSEVTCGPSPWQWLCILGAHASFGERKRLRQVWMCPQGKDGVVPDCVMCITDFGNCLTVFCEPQNQSSLEKALEIIEPSVNVALARPPLNHVPKC